jgi:uncharacterized membrane protein
MNASNEDFRPLSRAERQTQRWFYISVILKGLHAAIEIVGGVLLLIIPPGVLLNMIALLTQDELIEDPHDIVANTVGHFVSGLSISSIYFGAFYLLTHGIPKIILVIELLRNRYWAYPASLVVLGLFIVYQVYRYFVVSHSLGLVVLTVFDLVVMWLIWQEYKIIQKHRSIEV